MSREGLMDDCGYHEFDECSRLEICCSEEYARGKSDRDEEIIEAIIDHQKECDKIGVIPTAEWVKCWIRGEEI